MDSRFLALHGRQVTRAGALSFGLALLLGFLVPRFAAPRVGLSAHLLGVLQGLLLLTLGQLWSQLALGPRLSRATAGLVVGGCYLAWLANVLAASWHAGGTWLPHAAGAARGTPPQELAILLLLRAGGGALVLGWLAIFWGLRSGPLAPTSGRL